MECNYEPRAAKWKKGRRTIKMVCLNENLYCHSFYQVRRTYAHINQKREEDLDEAVGDVTKLV